MKILKKIAIGLLIILVVATGLFFYGISTHVDISDYESWYLKADEKQEIQAGAVQIKYVGISTILITDGKTHLMTDGFFSRPSSLRFLLSKVSPEKENIGWSLNKLGVKKLEAVFAVHSHFDHAMDSPEVVKQTNALLIGSESTANIGRGWGLKENQIKVFKHRQPMQFGDFKVTPILSKHFEFPDSDILKGDQNIRKPLVPPVKAMDYKMGGAYVLYFEHPKGNFLIQGSAGFIKDDLKNFKADIVFLGIGGLGSQTKAYQENYFKEVVDMLEAKKVFIIHWEDFFSPIDKPAKAPNLIADKLMAKTTASFEAVKREFNKRPGVKYNLLPQWKKVTLFK